MNRKASEIVTINLSFNIQVQLIRPPKTKRKVEETESNKCIKYLGSGFHYYANKNYTAGDESTTLYTELMKSWFEPGLNVHKFDGRGKNQGARSSTSKQCCKTGQEKCQWFICIYNHSQNWEVTYFLGTAPTYIQSHLSQLPTGELKSAHLLWRWQGVAFIAVGSK